MPKSRSTDSSPQQGRSARRLLAPSIASVARPAAVVAAVFAAAVAAAVVLRSLTSATESDLLAYCKDHLAAYKCPKQIHITDAIPRTATGKIQRRVVAEAFSRNTP